MTAASKAFRDCRELHNAFAGKDVWIAGSDPSLSGYPDSFFDDKVAITLHLAHVKFPRASFRYSSEYDRSQYLLEKDPDYARLPLIAALPMYGKTQRETRELLAGNSEVYFHRMISYPPYGVRGKVSAAYTEFKISQTRTNNATIWGGHGTCLHTCIYMAILGGARAIHLIGAGHGLYTEAGNEHFAAVESDHHSMRPGVRSFTDPIEHVALIEQTGLLRDLCREAGIGFHWYKEWTPEMNSEIEYSQDWLAQQKAASRRKFPLHKRLYRALVKAPLHWLISRF